MKSPQAQAAALIRKELKANNVPARVRSSTGSITVTLLDNPLPATVEKVKAAVGQYQYGHFDGMTDMYEYTNRRDDLPQVQYVFVYADYSEDFKQSVWAFVRQTMQGGEDAPESYLEGGNYNLQGEWGHSWVHRVLSGVELTGFWTAQKPRYV